MPFAKPLLAATAALALMTAGAAGAQTDSREAQDQQNQGQRSEGSQQGQSEVVQSCVDRLSELNETYRGQSEGVSQREMRNLFNAASILANNGQRDACIAVIEGIETVASIGGRQPPEGEPQEEAASQNMEQAFANAKPLGKAEAFATQAYLDNSVVGPSGEVLADVEEIVSTKDATYLVLGSGGFLDIGEEHRPVRMDRFLRIDADTLGLRISEEKFDSAPTFKRDRLVTDETDWVQQVESWWKSNAGGQNATGDATHGSGRQSSSSGKGDGQASASE